MGFHFWVGFVGIIVGALSAGIAVIWWGIVRNRVARQEERKANVKTCNKVVGRQVLKVPLETVPEPDYQSLANAAFIAWVFKWLGGVCAVLGLILVIVGTIERFAG